MDVGNWIIALERTRQLNRYHTIQVNLEQHKIDLYKIENTHNHYEVLKEIIYLKKPKIKLAYKTNVHDLIDEKYTFPIREINYTAGKHSICSEVDDSVFFTFKDRELALSRIFTEDANNLKHFGYLKWDENKLINFLTKRLIKKTKSK